MVVSSASSASSQPEAHKLTHTLGRPGAPVRARDHALNTQQVESLVVESGRGRGCRHGTQRVLVVWFLYVCFLVCLFVFGSALVMCFVTRVIRVVFAHMPSACARVCILDA